MQRLKITFWGLLKIPLQHKSLLLFITKKVIVAKVCCKEETAHNLPPCTVAADIIPRVVEDCKWVLQDFCQFSQNPAQVLPDQMGLGKQMGEQEVQVLLEIIGKQRTAFPAQRN